MKKKTVPSTMLVKDLLERHPQAQQFFLNKGLLCAGCPTEAFHTLSDVSREYHLDLNELIQSINEAIRDQDAG